MSANNTKLAVLITGSAAAGYLLSYLLNNYFSEKRNVAPPTVSKQIIIPTSDEDARIMKQLRQDFENMKTEADVFRDAKDKLYHQLQEVCCHFNLFECFVYSSF